MRSLLLLSALLATVSAPALAQPIDRATQARIDRILKRTPLIDGHNDLPWALREDFEMRVDGLQADSARRTPPLMTDMARLRDGPRRRTALVGLYFGDDHRRRRGSHDARADRRRPPADRRLSASDLALARTADDMVRIHRSGRIGSMLGAEGGNQMAESMASLRQYYDLGVRYMTLTHNQTTRVGRQRHRRAQA